MALKHVALLCTLHNAAAGVGTALPPYKKRKGFFSRGGGFAIGNTGPSEEIEALAGESFDWLANRSAPCGNQILLDGVEGDGDSTQSALRRRSSPAPSSRR